MNLKDYEYYPKDRPFIEVEITFFGIRINPRDLNFYLKLLSLNKKLGIEYPEYIIGNKFFSYGNYLRYDLRTILNNREKNSNIKVICDELIRYGIKTKSIPMIQFINYGEKRTSIYKLADYLKNKGIKLEDLNIEEITNQEINLEEIR